MKKVLPGIILLLTTPCSVLLFVKVESFMHSEFLALVSAVFLYVLVALGISFFFYLSSKGKSGTPRTGKRNT